MTLNTFKNVVQAYCSSRCLVFGWYTGLILIDQSTQTGTLRTSIRLRHFRFAPLHVKMSNAKGATYPNLSGDRITVCQFSSLLTCDWLTSRHKASDWLICDSWDLYHRIKTSTWMILFLLQHAADGCCNLQKKSSSFTLNYISKEGCKRILKSSWISLNRSNSLW